MVMTSSLGKDLCKCLVASSFLVFFCSCSGTQAFQYTWFGNNRIGCPPREHKTLRSHFTLFDSYSERSDPNFSLLSSNNKKNKKNDSNNSNSDNSTGPRRRKKKKNKFFLQSLLSSLNFPQDNSVDSSSYEPRPPQSRPPQYLLQQLKWWDRAYNVAFRGGRLTQIKPQPNPPTSTTTELGQSELIPRMVSFSTLSNKASINEEEEGEDEKSDTSSSLLDEQWTAQRGDLSVPSEAEAEGDYEPENFLPGSNRTTPDDEPPKDDDDASEQGPKAASDSSLDEPPQNLTNSSSMEEADASQSEKGGPTQRTDTPAQSTDQEEEDVVTTSPSNGRKMSNVVLELDEKYDDSAPAADNALKTSKLAAAAAMSSIVHDTSTAVASSVANASNAASELLASLQIGLEDSFNLGQSILERIQTSEWDGLSRWKDLTKRVNDDVDPTTILGAGVSTASLSILFLYQFGIVTERIIETAALIGITASFFAVTDNPFGEALRSLGNATSQILLSSLVNNDTSSTNSANDYNDAIAPYKGEGALVKPTASDAPSWTAEKAPSEESGLVFATTAMILMLGSGAKPEVALFIAGVALYLTTSQGHWGDLSRQIGNLILVVGKGLVIASTSSSESEEVNSLLSRITATTEQSMRSMEQDTQSQAVISVVSDGKPKEIELKKPKMSSLFFATAVAVVAETTLGVDEVEPKVSINELPVVVSTGVTRTTPMLLVQFERSMAQISLHGRRRPMDDEGVVKTTPSTTTLGVSRQNNNDDVVAAVVSTERQTCTLVRFELSEAQARLLGRSNINAPPNPETGSMELAAAAVDSGQVESSNQMMEEVMKETPFMSSNVGLPSMLLVKYERTMAQVRLHGRRRIDDLESTPITTTTPTTPIGFNRPNDDDNGVAAVVSTERRASSLARWELSEAQTRFFGRNTTLPKRTELVGVAAAAAATTTTIEVSVELPPPMNSLIPRQRTETNQFAPSESIFQRSSLPPKQDPQNTIPDVNEDKGEKSARPKAQKAARLEAGSSPIEMMARQRAEDAKRLKGEATQNVDEERMSDAEAVPSSDNDHSEEEPPPMVEQPQSPKREEDTMGMVAQAQSVTEAARLEEDFSAQRNLARSEIQQRELLKARLKLEATKSRVKTAIPHNRESEILQRILLGARFQKEGTTMSAQRVTEDFDGKPKTVSSQKSQAMDKKSQVEPENVTEERDSQSLEANPIVSEDGSVERLMNRRKEMEARQRGLLTARLKFAAAVLVKTVAGSVDDAMGKSTSEVQPSPGSENLTIDEGNAAPASVLLSNDHGFSEQEFGEQEGDIPVETKVDEGIERERRQRALLEARLKQDEVDRAERLERETKAARAPKLGLKLDRGLEATRAAIFLAKLVDGGPAKSVDAMPVPAELEQTKVERSHRSLLAARLKLVTAARERDRATTRERHQRSLLEARLTSKASIPEPNNDHESTLIHEEKETKLERERKVTTRLDPEASPAARPLNEFTTADDEVPFNKSMERMAVLKEPEQTTRERRQRSLLTARLKQVTTERMAAARDSDREMSTRERYQRALLEERLKQSRRQPYQKET